MFGISLFFFAIEIASSIDILLFILIPFKFHRNIICKTITGYKLDYLFQLVFFKANNLPLVF